MIEKVNPDHPDKIADRIAPPDQVYSFQISFPDASMPHI